MNDYIVGDREVIARLRRLPDSMRSAAKHSIARLVLRLQRHVQQNKLTGQVLKVRTGTLRRSIAQTVAEEPGGIVGIVSTNVKYARKWEFGFSGNEPVKAHLRMVKQAWGRTIANPRKVAVQAHSRLVDFPERSFLRSALKDMQPEIKRDLEQAMAHAAKAA